MLANRSSKSLKNQTRTKGEGWSTANWLSNFIAGRPEAGLLFWFFKVVLYVDFSNNACN